MFRNSVLVEKILRDRYYTAHETSWEQVAQRVSRYVASAHLQREPGDLGGTKQLEREFFDLIKDRAIIPNSPTLFNAGFNTDPELLYRDIGTMEIQDYLDIFSSAKSNGSLSACFVLDVDDSMESIYSTLKDMALITQSGGGVGFNFSKLRPSGCSVNGAGGVSSGPLPFMKAYDVSADAIKQGGKRRAALMGILDYRHPDVLAFIGSKKDNDGESVLRYFNISVDVDPDKFLELLETNGDVVFEHKKSGVTGKMPAREYLRKIAQNAWTSGDPGMVFTSRHNQYCAYSNNFPCSATNPCGEQFLPANGSCNLMSIDIAKCNDEYRIEYCATIATQFLDLVIDINKFPLEQIASSNSFYRDIGLGIMGAHDYLIQRDIAYGSNEGRIAIARVMALVTATAYTTSSVLAGAFGSAPAFDGSRFALEPEYMPIKMLDIPEMKSSNDWIRGVIDNIRMDGLRNMSVTTIAPTGTISQIAETSSGVEPNFSFAYTRWMTNNLGSKIKLDVVHRAIPEEYLGRVLSGESLYKITDNPVYMSAMEISAEDHLLMQAYAQAYTTNSISKTVNMPNDATVEDVERVYKLAMLLGVKGVTVYRDGSLTYQVLETPKEKKQLEFAMMPEREIELSGYTKVHADGDRKTYITVNFDSDINPVEVFINGDSRISELIGRMVSVAMRYGTPPEKIVAQLEKTGGYAGEIGAVLRDMLINAYVKPTDSKWGETSKGFYVDQYGNTKCHVCDEINTIHMTEGCVKCGSCFWGACSH